MKAYRFVDDRVGVFRTDRHHERLSKSLQRMCMPDIPFDLFENAIMTLVDTDREWVPNGPDGAFYLRPLIWASEEHVGLKPAEQFMFLLLGAPFRPIFRGPLRVKVEREFVRAAPGGVGSAKCAGNYAAAMYPTKMARDAGFDQVLWTDAHTHSQIEESGAMNVMFVIDGVVVTPPLSDTILDGVTRESILTLASDGGWKTEERNVSVDELVEGIASGRVTEAFGVGTAAVVAPIGTFGIDGVDHQLNATDASIAADLKTRLNDIRYGRDEDRYGWMSVVEQVNSDADLEY
jgi:branched-chain amino acid aminotransferase